MAANGVLDRSLLNNADAVDLVGRARRDRLTVALDSLAEDLRLDRSTLALELRMGPHAPRWCARVTVDESGGQKGVLGFFGRDPMEAICRLRSALVQWSAA